MNTDNDCLMYRPFQSTEYIEYNTFKIKRDHYSTSLDPRGYIPGWICPVVSIKSAFTYSLTVYEYMINNTPIMWDRETGYVHFYWYLESTGEFKVGYCQNGRLESRTWNQKDSRWIFTYTRNMVNSLLCVFLTPRAISYPIVCRIPYDFAHILCKRTAWHIRKELTPIFGHSFLSEALSPDHIDYGCLLLDPKNLPANGKNLVSHHKRNTMRQNNTKPYCKRPSTTTTKKLPRTPNNQ